MRYPCALIRSCQVGTPVNITPIRTSLTHVLLLMLLSVFLLGGSGCSSTKGKTHETESLTAAQLYKDAEHALKVGNFPRATQYLRRLQARFPFSPYAEQAQLQLAYAYYRNDQPEKALAAIKRFIRTYPTHQRVDYAYYLKGVVNFERSENFFDRLLPEAKYSRDLQFAEQAFYDFSDLINRFPDSRYAPDARQRMVYLKNLLAEQELQVARYYLRRGAWIAAQNRARYTIEHFPETPQSIEALEILAQAYDGLNKPELAADARQVLAANRKHLKHPMEKTGKGWLDYLWPF